MAGTVTVTALHGAAFTKITADWTADAADGSVPDTDLIAAIESGLELHGWIEKIVTKPGTPAPTDDYDVTLEDPEGVDVLGGAGADRDSSDSEQAVPLAGSARVASFVAAPSALTLKVTGNSVNSAQGRVVIYVSR